MEETAMLYSEITEAAQNDLPVIIIIKLWTQMHTGASYLLTLRRSIKPSITDKTY